MLVGRLYEKEKGSQKAFPQNKSPVKTAPKVEMGKFLLSIPKDLRREIKFEADEKGFGNASAYICHVLRRRKAIF